MDLAQLPPELQEQLGLQWVPIHAMEPGTPVAICLLLREQPEVGDSPFVMLREVPGSRIYLGAICDAAGRVQDWLEIWVQEPELKSATFSSQGKPLDNSTFDRLWRSEFECNRTSLPESVLVTGMEGKNPRPLLIRRAKDLAVPFAKAETTSWLLCTDDDLLKSFGLPPYSSSCHRYLYDPEVSGKKLFVATTADAPSNASVRGVNAAVMILLCIRLSELMSV